VEAKVTAFTYAIRSFPWARQAGEGNFPC